MGLDYLITALIVVLVPGTGVVYTVATGLTCGRRASIAAAFGCTLSMVPAIVATIVGLAAILHASALLFQLLKFAGVAYLIYLAFQTLQSRGPLALDENLPRGKSMLGIARTGLLINVFSPKLSAFFLAFLPQFVDPQAGSATAQMLTLSAVFMAMTFVVFVIYGFFASLAGERLLSSETVMNWMRRTIAGTFGVFAVRLALAER